MNGNMMHHPLLISDLIEHAAKYYPTGEIVSLRVEGDIHRYTYKDANIRSKKLANALTQSGISNGDRIGTLAWNGYRHFELYYGVSGMGAITHTINPRLFPEQIVYIINHAEDRMLFVDLSFVPLLEQIHDKIPTVESIVIMADKSHMPDTNIPNVLCYEDYIENASEEFAWPQLDEDCAAAICYTSGTTGNPKGVVYSHKSTLLHALAGALPDALNLSSRCTLLPVVPMFHVCAWGTPYAATLTGAKLVLPGAGLDGASLTSLIKTEQVNLLLGVPTIWLGLLQYLKANDIRLDNVETVVIGGAAAPLSMIKSFDEDHGAFVMHAWGMTEMSPIGTIGSYTREMDNITTDERYALQQKQGRPVFGVQLKIIDDDGNTLANDGVAFGRLMVKGPWIAERYFKAETTALEDGWFDTGDVATLDPQGYMKIVDRNKDVIKSGGEWISSIDLENAAVGHPAIQEACVIGIHHPKWDERPLLLAIKQEGQETSKEDIIAYLSDKVAKWWLPNDVVFVNELPHTATGKLLKVNLREDYSDHYINHPS